MMNEKEMINTIQKFTATVFENSIDEMEAEKKINEIHAYFQQITDITGSDFVIEHMAAIPTARGKALGLNFAAQCLLDYKRTIKFLRAIVKAITEKQQQQPGVVINIFYAGCGPYAPFVTLVAPFFKPEEVQFSVLEINKKSLDTAKKLIDTLKLSNYVAIFYEADAVTFRVPNPELFDILISETLDAMLFRECYVPILFNLLPQFKKDIILIPENVLIDYSFIPHSEENVVYQENQKGSVLNVRESISSYPNSDAIPSQLSDIKVDLTSLKMDKFEKVILDTKVHIYKDIWLYRNESSLTIPLEMTIEQPFLDKAIIFTYYLEPEIELKYRLE
jgi:predicted RNA methylase